MPPSRFITETSLDYLARRLRFLGYDIVTAPNTRLEELFAVARRDGRTVLTLSARHPRRFADVAALSVPREDPEAALRGIAQVFEPAGPPFSRCPVDNTALQRRHAFEARGEVPGRVAREAEFLSHCPTCGKWYWEGSHVGRLKAWLERAVGRPVQSAARPPDTSG